MPTSNRRKGLPPAPWFEQMMDAARKRRAYILELVAQGKTHEEIAALLNVSRQRVGVLVLKAQREAKNPGRRVSRGTKASTA